MQQNTRAVVPAGSGSNGRGRPQGGRGGNERGQVTGSAELGFLEKERKRRRKEKRAKIIIRKDLACGFRQGVIRTRCEFELNLSYIGGLVNSRCLGKEPFEFGGFRVEKRARKIVKHMGKGVGRRASQRAPKSSLRFHSWGAAPARTPQARL
uniref:Uncharacterized protein n=1 Tax=Solanum tuberosum TaxID=4113 RepID=M1DUC7_SOLTU